MSPLENSNFNIGDTEDLMCEAFPFCNQNIVAIWKKHVQSQPPTYIYVSADPYFRKEFNSVGEEYRGRTKYFIKGHYARLKIFQLKAEDEGIYSCEIYSLQDQPKCYYSIQFFKLNLKPGEPRYNYEFNITKYGILKENQVEQMPNTSQRNLSWNILFIISTIALLGSFENSLFK
ncbi:uncharacterized protein LOC118200998 [Stegodyphus dumicola]|uniref:uncharacterized protein LOC118200998 n=1 Tax=Stegodyphus dumicola TaxID=202533 RepID=UPI0015A97BF8|nr:uncharacterized protein LOC118200998 [Stegodyphus dumicola]